jgi:HlyD family secretion protein
MRHCRSKSNFADQYMLWRCGVNAPTDPRPQVDVRAILRSGTPGTATLLWRRRAVSAVVIAMAAAGGIWLWASSGSSNAVRYTTEAVTRRNLVVGVTATGSVQPTNKVDVSSELSGTIRKVLVDFNSTVKAGQTLAELDTDKLRATVDSSRARLTAARAKVAEAEATMREKDRELARKLSLAEKQVTSRHDLDVAQAAFDRAVAALASARADVAVAEADLRLNETNLAKACICSPINGVVLKRNVDPGQTVASTFQAPVLFSIAEDLSQMELQVDVDEADVGKVKIGQAASFTVDAFPDRRFPAQIRDVRYASETIQGVVTYKAVLTIDNAEQLLRPGMTATAEITVAEVRDALLVPNAALRYTPPANSSGDTRSLLRRLMPGPPRFRSPSSPDSTGPNRSVWTLRNGKPSQFRVVVGASDGKLSEIVSGEVRLGDALVVDQTTGKP